MKNDSPAIDNAEQVWLQKFFMLRGALLVSCVLNIAALYFGSSHNFSGAWATPVRTARNIFSFPLLMFSGITSSTLSMTLSFLFLIISLASILLPRSRMFVALSAWLYFNITNQAWWTLDGGSNVLSLLLIFLIGTQTFRSTGFRLPFSRRPIGAHEMFVKMARAQIIIMYIVAVIAKLRGRLWGSGMAIFYISQNDYYTSDWARHLFHLWPELSVIACYLVIAWQASFVFLVSRAEWRRWALATGTLFHASIAVCMNLWVFSATMILLYASFLENGDLDFLRKARIKLSAIILGRLRAWRLTWKR